MWKKEKEVVDKKVRVWIKCENDIKKCVGKNKNEIRQTKISGVGKDSSEWL